MKSFNPFLARYALSFITARIRSLRESNVFSHVYLSVHGVRGVHVTSSLTTTTWGPQTTPNQNGPVQFCLLGTLPPDHTSIGKEAVGLPLKGFFVYDISVETINANIPNIS